MPEVEIYRALGIVVVLLHVLVGVAGGVCAPQNIALLGKLGNGEVLGYVIIINYIRHSAVVDHLVVPGVPGGICQKCEVFSILCRPEFGFAGIDPITSVVVELAVVKHKAKIFVV